MAKGYEKYLQRLGHTTGRMSKHLPKPNVCRIEVMDGAARRSYMGGFQGTLDCFKEQMIDALANGRYDLYEPFYGILDNAASGSGPSFEVKANWRDNQGKKSGFAKMSQIITGTGGKSGLLGRIPLMSGVNSLANGVFNTVEQVATAGMQLAGVNNNCTGSMTIKDFAGATIDSTLPLKFQWYMPEQEDMCRMSLKRLIMMAYVRPMDMEAFDIMNAMIDGVLAAGKNLQPVLDKIKSSVSDMYGGAAQTVGDFMEAPKNGMRDTYDQTLDFWGGPGTGKANRDSWNTIYNEGKSTAGNIVEEGIHVAKGVIATGIDAYNSINKYFGGEITANPLPVRVSIGHYLDLEPMVINSVKIYASTEQFISSDGTHLPIFMNADVNVSYWMQPGPTKDFISILGNEVFEQFIDRSKQKVQGAGNGNGESKKNQNKKNKNNPTRKKKR